MNKDLALSLLEGKECLNHLFWGIKNTFGGESLPLSATAMLVRPNLFLHLHPHWVLTYLLLDDHGGLISLLHPHWVVTYLQLGDHGGLISLLHLHSHWVLTYFLLGDHGGLISLLSLLFLSSIPPCFQPSSHINIFLLQM